MLRLSQSTARGDKQGISFLRRLDYLNCQNAGLTFQKTNLKTNTSSERSPRKDLSQPLKPYLLLSPSLRKLVIINPVHLRYQIFIINCVLKYSYLINVEVFERITFDKELISSY